MISGRGFADKCSWVHDPRYPEKRQFYYQLAKDGDWVFINGDYIDSFINKLPTVRTKSFTMIIHNSDRSFGKSELDKLLSVAEHIYAINTVVRHPKLTTIPIGFIDKRIQEIASFKKPEYERTIEIYCNFKVVHNAPKRQECMDVFKNDPRVVVRTETEFLPYLDDLCRSKFVLCPEGTGIDTHRVYEALLCGATPVVVRNSLSHLYEQLPVCIIERWSDPLYQPKKVFNMNIDEYIYKQMSYYDAAYSSRDTVENTKFYTQQIVNRNIPGALVECGVAGGAQLGAMFDVVGSSRWIYGFDSFEGIPIASVNDSVQPGIGANPMVPYNNVNELLRSSGVTVHGYQSVRNNLNRWTGNKSDTIVLVKGWFQKTLSQYRSVFQQLGGIALLRLDGDLYESTKVSLQQLFPLLSDGGILIIDDWSLSGCRKACEEYFTYNPVCQLPYVYGTEQDGPAYFIKRSVPALALRKNVFSQNGEDGILQELLRRIQNPTGWLCEFGAWDGKQFSNTFKLVREGYNAVYIEGREDYFQLLLNTANEYPSIVPIHKMVGYEGNDTLDNILATTSIPTDFDILSIDIDSYDYQVWSAVELYTPKIVIIEINSCISPLNETHIHSTEKEGTGFHPMMNLGISKGYTLICHTGNMIFVRNELAHLYNDLIIPPTECYRSTWIF